MIPEFPLPPVDADFYKSQIYSLPPIFGHMITATPKLLNVENSTTFFNKVENPIGKNYKQSIASSTSTPSLKTFTPSSVRAPNSHVIKSSISKPLQNAATNLARLATSAVSFSSFLAVN